MIIQGLMEVLQPMTILLVAIGTVWVSSSALSQA